MQMQVLSHWEVPRVLQKTFQKSNNFKLTFVWKRMKIIWVCGPENAAFIPGQETKEEAKAVQM